MREYIRAFGIMMKIRHGVHLQRSLRGLCGNTLIPDQSFAYTDSLASLVGLPSFSSVYGSVMASKNRSVDLGTGGYAASCNAGTSLMNGWYGEYGLTSCNADSQKIAVNAGANSPFTYAGIARTGNV